MGTLEEARSLNMFPRDAKLEHLKYNSKKNNEIEDVDERGELRLIYLLYCKFRIVCIE